MSIMQLPLPVLASWVLRSAVTRLGYRSEQHAFDAFGLLETRSAARYQRDTLLPIRHWYGLDSALRRDGLHDGDPLLPHLDLVRAGLVIHHFADSAEAAWREGAPPRRYAFQASADVVHDVGERLLCGDRLTSDELLLVPRFIRAHTTGSGLRRKAVTAVGALWDQREFRPDFGDNYGDPYIREALRNMDAGAASEIAIEVISGSAAAEACPCFVADEVLFVNSPRRASVIEQIFETHEWEHHDAIMRAASVLEMQSPLERLGSGYSVDFAVQEFIGTYLSALYQRSRAAGTKIWKLVNDLLADHESSTSQFGTLDLEAVRSARLIDRTGANLRNDCILPILWNDMLLGSDPAACSNALTLAACLGLDAQAELVSLALDAALSDRLRANAVRALASFSSSAIEPVFRTLASDTGNVESLRIQALWYYSSHGASTGWMFPILADPSSAIREALMFGAAQENPQVIMAGTLDPQPRVAAVAQCEAIRLGIARMPLAPPATPPAVI